MNELISPQDRDDLIRVGCTPEELKQIELFYTPFSLVARTYLSRIFVWGKLRRKPFEQILAACRTHWESVWKHGTSGRIGDTDDTSVIPGSENAKGHPDCHGMRNTCTFFQVYKDLGMPLPKFLFS